MVQSFVNSRWDLEHDQEEQLTNPPELARWLVERGLLEAGTRLTAGDLRRALDLREGLRALLFVNNGAAADRSAVERLNRAVASAPLSLRFDPAAPPSFGTPAHDLDGALASLASIVAVAQIDGTWSRLKACRGLHCGWTFYDHSRNQSGSWCSMSTCGSRSKAREYRRRKRVS